MDKEPFALPLICGGDMVQLSLLRNGRYEPLVFSHDVVVCMCRQQWGWSPRRGGQK